MADKSLLGFHVDFQNDLYPTDSSKFGALPDDKMPLWTNFIFLLFPIGHLHSESRNLVPETTSHGKLRLLLVERNNIKMDEVSLMAQVMPAKGIVKFCETPHLPPYTQTARPL